MAPPYTLVAPTAYPEVVSLRTPEYSWAQGLVVALHLLRLCVLQQTVVRPYAAACCSGTAGYDPAYPQLAYDSAIRILYGELPDVALRGSPWANSRLRMEEIRERTALRTIEKHPHCWDSGTEIYGQSGKSHHFIVTGPLWLLKHPQPHGSGCTPTQMVRIPYQF